MLHEGDVARGKQLFSDPQRTACSTCHATDGSASKAGPNLFAAGDAFTRSELIDTILTPSATIANGYNTTMIETKAGESYTGILKQAADSFIELIGADGIKRRIARAEIASQTTSEVSLMPEGLQNALSLEEFCDLIEYLVSLKQPQNTRMLEAGMPSAIQELSPRVELAPFITEDLRFDHPVWFGPVPGETNVFFGVEHETGEIWRLDKKSSNHAKTLFVNLGRYQQGTRGLLGIALHPRFPENGRYFLAKHVVENGSFSTLILERVATADRAIDSGKDSKLLLKIEETSNVHYGGGLQFGPDGYFYIGMGDSGPQEDPNGNAQNTKSFLGKMLRIDVDQHINATSLPHWPTQPANSDSRIRTSSGLESGLQPASQSSGSESSVQPVARPYSIPSDNPFLNRSDYQPEIWALGLREPWRFSFDSLTGDLWVGDVGQDRYEEVDLVRRGENYGWNVYEGFEPFSNRYRRTGEKYVPPVFAYGRKFGVSVTGGFVYRADPGSSFYGVYIFADYQSRRIWGLTQENRVLKTIRQIALCAERVVSFGTDHAGNLYVVGYDGMIYKMNFKTSSFR